MGLLFSACERHLVVVVSFGRSPWWLAIVREGSTEALQEKLDNARDRVVLAYLPSFYATMGLDEEREANPFRSNHWLYSHSIGGH